MRTMETMGDRIRRLREAQNLNPRDFAKRVGLAYSSLMDLENGNSKSTKRLHAIIAELSTTADYLEHGRGSEYVEQALRIAPSATDGYVRVEQIDADGGMGGPIVNDDLPEVIRSVEYAETYIRALIGFVPPPGRLKLVTGRGDSMRPVIEPGEVTLMDSGVKTFEGDGIYWITLGPLAIDDGQQIKMLQDRGDGLWVVSANPMYPAFKFPEHGRIGGKLYIRHKIERFS